MAKAVPAHQGSLEQQLSKAKPLYHLAASLCSITGWGARRELDLCSKAEAHPKGAKCWRLSGPALLVSGWQTIWKGELSSTPQRLHRYLEEQQSLEDSGRESRDHSSDHHLHFLNHRSLDPRKRLQNNLFFSFFKAICNPTYSSRNLSLRRSSQINLRTSSGCLTWTLITFC